MKNTPIQAISTSTSNSLQDLQRSLFNENPSNIKRSFIEYNQPLMGTGKLMRNPQEVHSSVRLSHIKELKDYVVQLKYAGLVHLCNLEERRKQITGSTDYAPKLKVQDWVLNVLNKVKETDSSQWLIQRDDTRQHLSYRVTLFQSESLKPNGQPQKTGTADRLILSHYGKYEKELEVQTGFPISHSQLEFEQQNKEVIYVAGTPFKTWKKQCNTIENIENTALPAQTAISAKTKTVEEVPNKSNDESETTQVQTVTSPKTQTAKAPHKFIASTAKTMRELHELTRQAYTQINILKLTGPSNESKAYLEDYGFDTKTLGALSCELSDQKNPQLDLTDTTQRKRAHYIDYNLLISPASSEFVHLLDDLRCITGTKLCLETQLEDLPKLVKNGTINSKEKSQLEKFHKQLLQDVGTLQREINTFLLPLMHAISGLLNEYNNYYTQQSDLANKALKGQIPLMDSIQKYCNDYHKMEYYAGLLQSIIVKAHAHEPHKSGQKPGSTSPENHQAQVSKQQNATKKAQKQMHNTNAMSRYIDNLLQLTEEHDPHLKKQSAKKYDEYVNACNSFIQLHSSVSDYQEARTALSKHPRIAEYIRYSMQVEQIAPPDLKAHVAADTYSQFVKGHLDFKALYGKVKTVDRSIVESQTIQDLLSIETPKFKKAEDYQAVATTIIALNANVMKVLKSEYLSYLQRK